MSLFMDRDLFGSSGYYLLRLDGFYRILEA